MTPTSIRRILIAAVLSVLAVAVHGFHYGIEDETIYLPAVKLLLNPALFPHDTALVHAQTRLTLFPPFMADLDYITRFPLQWVFFLVFCLTTFFFVLALMRLAERLFDQPAVRYCAVLLVVPILTMPVSGTALFMMDQHLHPRNIATVMILFALTAILDQRPVAAGMYLLAGFAMHPLVTLYGICLVGFQKWRSACLVVLSVGLIGARLIVGNGSDPWHVAMSTVHYYLVTSWAWYEWLGIVGPLIGFEIFGRWAHRRGLHVLGALCRQLLAYGVVLLVAALAISWIPWLYRLVPLQPMRHLQLLYILFFFIAGGVLAHEFARFRQYMWVLTPILCAGLFAAQRGEFPASAHIELPNVRPSNAWIRGFGWIQKNTSQDAYFALNPRYLELPGEDFHGFRALAERSMLADDIDDRVVATIEPGVATTWLEQDTALSSWKDFTGADLRSLKNRFGVDWVVLESGHPALTAAMVCPYRNESMAVCRLQ